MNRYLLAALVLGCSFAQAPASHPAPPPPHTLEHAVGVLDDLAALPLKGIPPKLLADAQAVVIVPRAVKVGLVIGARGGHGVVLTRDKDGHWTGPVFVHFGGPSIGLQAGIESTDVVLVFRSRKSLDRVLDGKEKLTLGADAAVAAGPVGREVLAATDPRLEAEVLSYSRTRGLFVGVVLDGSVIRPDPDGNAAFAKTAGADEKKWAEQLKTKLGEMSSTRAAPPTQPGAAPVLLPPVSPVPPPPRFPRLRARPWGGR